MMMTSNRPIEEWGNDVTRFDIPMNQLLFVYRSQPGGDLAGDFQCQLYLKPTGASDEFFERFSLYELHRVKVVLTDCARVEDRGNIRVTNARRCTGFTQKAKPRRFITKVSLARPRPSFSSQDSESCNYSMPSLANFSRNAN